MTVKEFADRHKVRTKFDEEGEAIVLAKHGQIYAYSSHRFGVMFLLDSVGKWNNRRKECEAAGMKVIQDGETEGCLLFDPENRDQVRTAIRAVGAYRKVNLTPEQRQARAERLKRNLQASQTPMN